MTRFLPRCVILTALAAIQCGGEPPTTSDDSDQGQQWASLNGCQGAPQPANDLCQSLTNCNGGVEVKLCALNAGHVLFDNAHGFSVPDVV